MILGAEDKLFSLEYDLFCGVRDAIAAEVVRIQKTARAIAAAGCIRISVCRGIPEATT